MEPNKTRLESHANFTCKWCGEGFYNYWVGVYHERSECKRQGKATRDHATGKYRYGYWTIEPVGGFGTIRRFIGTRGERQVWAFKLKDVVAFCDKLDGGKKVPDLYLRPLYH